MQSANHSKLACVIALSAAALTANAQDTGRTITPDEMRWKPGRVAGTEVVNLVGDATKPEAYVLRIRFPPNFKIQPHSHPEERQYTIISGTWYVAWGNQPDESNLKALPAGSVYTEPANVPHFVLTKAEPVIVQITGVGPTATRMVDAAGAPKK